MRTFLMRAGVAGTATVAALAAAIPAGESVTPGSAIVFVAPTGSSSGADTNCSTARYSTVQSAVDAVQTGGTVLVCRGTYKESVSITRQLTLRGLSGSVIDATGQPYGVGIGADYVRVSGLTVVNANSSNDNYPDDGILTGALVGGNPVIGNHATITDNIVRNNLGSGIDVNSSSYNVVANNVSTNNGVGINVSDDLGAPASHNTITSNNASNNPGGCGIVLADHSGAGIFANIVRGNTANNNGLGTPSAPNASSGSGIILAGGPKGGVYNNVVMSNYFSGNGHAGVALHAHAPGANFNGNKIGDNTIATNNKRTDYKDLQTTGIYLGSAGKMTIYIYNNYIRDNKVGIFTAGPITVKGGGNAYANVTRQLVHISSYGG